MEGLILFVVILIALLGGYYVAFCFAGISFLVGSLLVSPELFQFMPYRIMSIMENTILMAIPMFIYMGIMLQRSKIAEQLLESFAKLFMRYPGGLAIGTIIVGALLSASTGVVGASVIAMGVISLPVMLKHHYDKSIASGTICATGTLGQIVPPSIVLILLGDVIGIPVGDLFRAAIIPGALLIIGYTAYILIRVYLNPNLCPPIDDQQDIPLQQLYWLVVKKTIPTIALIAIVLCSIFFGLATPTESAAMGAVGAVVLAYIYGQCQWQTLLEVAKETVKITSMVFVILIGATAFSLVFSYIGTDTLIEKWVLELPHQKWLFISMTMLLILVLGFFIDFIEISYIVVPILAPIAYLLNIDLQWFAILIALNLQTSFLTPPFGFSLFFLRGVAPPTVLSSDIYKGVLPFIAIQIFVILLVILYPHLIELT